MKVKEWWKKPNTVQKLKPVFDDISKNGNNKSETIYGNNKSETIYGNNNENEKFKKLIRKRIPPNDNIWTTMFDIDRFFQEPYSKKLDNIFSK